MFVDNTKVHISVKHDLTARHYV